MKASMSFRFFFLVLAIIIGLDFPPLSSFAEENPDNPVAKASTVEEQEATFIQIYSWATILPKEFIDLESELSREKNTARDH